MVIVFGIVGLLLSIFYLICFWRLFSKAGRPGWFAVIPIFNIIMFYIITKNIIFLPIIVIFSIIFSIVSFIVGDIFVILSFICLAIIILCSFICHIRFYKAYGHGLLFSIISILFGFITIPIIAFGN